MTRTAEHEIEPFFIARSSKRAMSAEPVEEALLFRLFEAARWAPSSNNLQPWRFVYSVRGSDSYESFFSLLNPWNQNWAVHGGALIVLCARTIDNKGNPNPCAVFDAGAAWMSLALQASAMGLVLHCLAGIDFERAPSVIAMPEHHIVCAMIVVGKTGPVEALPDYLRPRESPNGREPVASFAYASTFPAAK